MTTTVLPPSVETASQREYAEIEAELRALAPRLRDAEKHELRVLIRRLCLQIAHDAEATRACDAAIDRALACWRERRLDASLTPKDLMAELLAAARGRE